MPRHTTKKRQELRSVFSTNAIPTERDYADLIAAGLNQADDGLLKLPDQPLGLVRQKPPASATTASAPSTASASTPAGVLNFFGEPEDASPSWQLQLIGSSRPGFALADQAGTPRLFLDGTTGNLGVGTTTPAQRLTVEGPWGPGSDSANTLRNLGQLAIKGTKAQLDFIDPDPNHTDWAIHVDDSKLSFVRSPWQNKDLVLDGQGNVGIGVESPTKRLHVAGEMCVEGALELRGDLNVSGRLPLRRVWFNTDNSDYTNHTFTSGQISGRVLKIRKLSPSSVLRITYSDNHMAQGTGGWSGARWEVKLFGNTDKTPNVFDRAISYQKPIYSDRNSVNNHNDHTHSTIVGYASGVPEGVYEIRVHVYPVPGGENRLHNTGTGWDKSTWSLEAEEIFQNTLQNTL